MLRNIRRLGINRSNPWTNQRYPKTEACGGKCSCKSQSFKEDKVKKDFQGAVFLLSKYQKDVDWTLEDRKTVNKLLENHKE